MEWQSVLAGPMVRRVDARGAAVWIALDIPCVVTLRIFRGLRMAGGSAGLVVEASALTRRFGEHLNIAVVHAITQLDPGTIYSYDLQFAPLGTDPSADLASLDLLKDRSGPQRHLALGYLEGSLPSFVTQPAEFTDLKLLHGSCRRPGLLQHDALSWVDRFIAVDRASATLRPHQLLLSGDQIYADDVMPPLLSIITPKMNELLGRLRDDSEDLVPREHLPVAGADWPADLLRFPDGRRRELVLDEARFTTTDGDSHLLSFAEFVGHHLFVWSNAPWPETLPTAESYIGPPLGPAGGRPKFVASWMDLEGKAGEDRRAAQTRRHPDRLAILERIRGTLPEVRRAMANIATYMVFDDHEITDDWNINAVWVHRVLGSPLGRAAIRNGLMAYAICQAWGNDPEAFESGPNREFLDATEAAFPPPAAPEAAGRYPVAEAAKRIDSLAGLAPGEGPSKVRWHYSVDGPKHRLVVLDNRTRRGFATSVSPPQNITPIGLRDQLPEGPLPAGHEAIIVVSSLCVLGVPVFDELFGSLVFRIKDAIHGVSDAAKDVPEPLTTPGLDPDAVESWSYAPQALEALLARLAPYRRVVVLSGDVHFGATVEMSYWDRSTHDLPAPIATMRVAQFIASGFVNRFKRNIVALNRAIALSERILRAKIGAERIGFDSPDPSPVEVPSSTSPPRALRRRLRETPLLLPTEGWPEGTRLRSDRPFDWAWRMTPTSDLRADAERPALGRDATLPNDGDVTQDVEGYRSVLTRQRRQLDRSYHTRQILWANNIGRVGFRRDGDTLVATQELWAVHPRATPDNVPEPYTVHEVRLDPDPAELPPTIPPARQGGLP